MTGPKRIAAIGECMIELSQAEPDRLRLAYAGDTSNTAVYLARLGQRVDYVTAVGDDPYSDGMLAFWRDEKVGTERVRRLPGRLPGLYMIRTDEHGERQFHYWRSAAAARALMQGPDLDFEGISVIYYSAISLQILVPDDRHALLARIAAARAGGARIVFDSNYRPTGWPDAATAGRFIEAAWRNCDIALPTFEDEQAVFGDATPQDCIARLAGLGVGEIALKCGAEGAVLGGHDRSTGTVPAPEAVEPHDTTGAGDSFNAGYLAARLSGEDTTQAAQAGHRLAGAVIRHPGAIMPREAMP